MYLSFLLFTLFLYNIRRLCTCDLSLYLIVYNARVLYDMSAIGRIPKVEFASLYIETLILLLSIVP